MASLLGLCLFGETMTAFQLIGGALIVIGGVSQIVFTTKAANEVEGDAAVNGEVSLAAQVGAGGAGLIDATPDGMDPAHGDQGRRCRRGGAPVRLRAREAGVRLVRRQVARRWRLF